MIQEVILKYSARIRWHENEIITLRRRIDKLQKYRAKEITGEQTTL